MIEKKVAKNALVLMLATTGQKFIAFVAFTLVARFVGAEITGTYFYAVSVTSIFVTLSDLGITPVVIRAIAGNTKNSERLFGAAIRAKLFLIPIAVIASLFYGVAIGNPPLIIATIGVACVAMAADALHLIFYGVLRGRQNLKPEAIGMFIGQAITATVAISAAWLDLGPVGLAFALVCGSLWNVLWSSLNLRRLKVKFPSPFKSDIKDLVWQALPFAVAGISVKVYSYIDSLMLQAYKGSTAVGYYAVAYKLTYAMQFLPLTFTAALYPALSASYANKEKAELKQMFVGALRLMAAIGFPISAGLSALAPRLIPALYTNEFAGSIAAMEVLPWVLLPIFLDFPIGALLNGSNRAYLKTSAMVATMLINAILNAILIPWYGPLGAAWAGVFSFWFLLSVGIIFTVKDVGGIWHFASILGRAISAAAASWALWRFVGAYMPLYMAFVFGAACAVILAFAVRLVTVQDILPLWRGLKNRFSKPETVHES